MLRCSSARAGIAAGSLLVDNCQECHEDGNDEDASQDEGAAAQAGGCLGLFFGAQPFCFSHLLSRFQLELALALGGG